MIIAYIAYIQENGEISMLTSVPSSIPENGAITEDGLLIKHLLQSDLDALNFLEPGDVFHETYFWKDGSWAYRGPRGSIYHIWDSSSEEWIKDSAVIISATRRDRDIRLGSSDWTQASDSPLTPAKIAEWATYRQALRDSMAYLPGTLDLPEDIVWPTPPT